MKLAWSASLAVCCHMNKNSKHLPSSDICISLHWERQIENNFLIGSFIPSSNAADIS